MITGEWNFTSGLSATIGAPLQFRGDTASVAVFEAATISGLPGRVLRLPALTAEQGLIMPHGAAANGGTNVNDYTLLMDAMWPTESDGTWRALLQSDTNNAAESDAIFFVNPANAIGVNNQYNGNLAVNQWHRVALVFELSQNRITSFINGQTNLVHTLNNALDGRFSLRPTALLFTDNDGESQPVLINSLQFRSAAMGGEELAALGGATPGGFSGEVTPLPDVKIERVQKIGSEVVLTVSGGGNLQLQKSATLLTNSWQNLGSAAVTNTFRVPASDSKAFFRIERL